ncbi:YidH family protein [Parasphingorhabdus sp. NYA22]
MATETSSTDLASERTDLAEDRTEWAEDRTIMANERTFAGWMRTGLAAVGIGLGFNALFGKLEPLWVPKAIATLFMIIGIFIFWVAQRNGCAVQDRLNSHQATPVKPHNMRIVSGLMASGAVALIVAIWTMKFGR